MTRILFLLLVSCASTANLHTTRIQWDREPTIGVSEDSLIDSTQWAIEQWGWGRFVGSCQGADICVKRGFVTPFDASLGRAYWPGERNACDAVIYQPTREAVIVAHEIGHCFGLGHSEHSHSVMIAAINSDWDHWYWVTYDDREALEKVK